MAVLATVLACPVCDADLRIGATTATCPNGHAFDRARGGYLNLLLSNRKQSAEPGDSAAMMQSRRRFLQGGFYDRMADAANHAVSGALAGRSAAHVVDLGCGEGFFTTRLQHALAAAMPGAPACYGVDISRPGIKLASAGNREITWIVASLHRSPFRPRSLDVALSIFAPIDASDVRRILRDDGALITVTPGPDHLDALRALIYTAVKPHPETPALMAGDTLFEQAGVTRVRYPIQVDSPAQVMNLLAMTPYYWNISRATRGRIEALSRIELTVDAYVTVFRPVVGVQ
jgi:23S rRNA (guanine745-N1)-methyltransferase